MSDAKPWWKFGYVWLVLAGPIIVVVAGLHTFWLAVTMPDPVLAAPSVQMEPDTNMAPAQQARNHAQTGVPGNAKAP